MNRVLTKTLRDAPDFVRCWDELADLRERAGARGDVLLSPLHFLAATDDTRRSCSVACWRDGLLVGVVYATEHFVRHMGTGYAVGGDFTGRGLLLCAPQDESLVLEEAIKRITAEGVHSLHLRFLPRERSRIQSKGLRMRFLDAVIPGDRIKLQTTFEEFLSRMGKHTRRNIRAYTRKTSEAEIEFVPMLTKQEYLEAAQHLNVASSFPVDALHMARDERLLELHSGGWRMGLRKGGNMIAVLCGFGIGPRFHLLTQFNDTRFERFSLSLVLRGYTIKHLIEAGYEEIQFMGGSSLSFGRFCEPQAYRSIFIDKRRGISAAIKLLCGRVAKLIATLDWPLPESLIILSGGHLDEARLSERTALRPAAMLFSQRRQHQMSTQE